MKKSKCTIEYYQNLAQENGVKFKLITLDKLKAKDKAKCYSCLTANVATIRPSTSIGAVNKIEFVKLLAKFLNGDNLTACIYGEDLIIFSKDKKNPAIASVYLGE